MWCGHGPYTFQHKVINEFVKINRHYNRKLSINAKKIFRCCVDSSAFLYLFSSADIESHFFNDACV